MIENDIKQDDIANLFESEEDSQYILLLIKMLKNRKIIVEGITEKRFLNEFETATLMLTNRCNLSCYHCCQDAINGEIESQEGFVEGGRLYCDMNNFYVQDSAEKENELIYPANANENGAYQAIMYGLDSLPWNQLKLIDGKLDEKKLSTGKYILVGVETDDEGNPISELYHFKVGDEVTIEKALKNDNTGTISYKSLSFTVLGHVAMNYYTNTSWSSCNYNFYLPTDIFTTVVEQPKVMSYTCNVDENHVVQVGKFMKDYTENVNIEMGYESKLIYKQQFAKSYNMIALVGGFLAFIIGMVGIINFASTIFTAIQTRIRELAMLESIGMEDKQVNKMLIYEGLYYAMFTIIISILMSIAASYGVSKSFAAIYNYYVYHFTLWSFAVAAPVLGIISSIVPYISKKLCTKQSIIERLRDNT